MPVHILERLENRMLTDEIAIWLDAAVKAVLGGAYKAKELGRLLADSRRDLHRPCTPVEFYRKVVQVAYRTEDFEPLLPFLQAADAVLPFAEAVHPRDPTPHDLEKFAREWLELAAGDGTLQEFSRPQPQVEQWIARTARRILEMLPRSACCDPCDEAQLFRLLLGAVAALHDLLGGVAPYFRRVISAACREVSFVAHAIAEVRRALLWTVVRDVLAGEDLREGGLEAFVRASAAYQESRIKVYALPGQSAFSGVRTYIERLAADRDDLAEAASTLESLTLLPKLAACLRQCPWFEEGRVDEGGAERVLPFGQITLVRPYGTKGRAVYYAADGVAHEAVVAHSGPDRAWAADEEVTPLLPPARGVTLGNVLSCRVDDAGKVYFATLDRLAPPPRDDEYREAARVVARIEASCTRMLRREWERYPELFARLDQLGPLVLVHWPPGESLLCRVEIAAEIQTLLGCARQAQGAAEALFARAHLRPNGAWAALTLEGRDTRRHTERERWRAVIRARIGGRVPDFAWLTTKLAAFGVRETTRGKGGHGSLVRAHGGQERRQTTWPALRKARPVPLHWLWEFLERLGISYQEFAASLGGETSGGAA
jgi:hypothetical protein